MASQANQQLYVLDDQYAVLGADTNQARGIAQFAIDFLAGKLGQGPAQVALDRTNQFHVDSVMCGLSALALGTNAPTVLRAEALDYSMEQGNNAKVFGSKRGVPTEKAVVANVSAVREWDSNGTVFGFNARLGATHMAGEFGHNDFYPVVVAAIQAAGGNGDKALKAMLLLDEIRGRLAEVFSLKTYHIDHVVHGAIASAAVYGALVGATAQQIESAIGMVVAHYIPFRAIRAGEQLSDSKGASAAISSEVAVMSVHRAMRGFIGPQDIFRNPEAIFRKFKPTTKSEKGPSPFELVLTHSGADFAVMGMHFKLGLYEHQSAGAIQGLIQVLAANPHLLTEKIDAVKITAYQPAFGIIGDPAKRNPETRQSADHSMVYIISRLLKKAREAGEIKDADPVKLWTSLMLLPIDYSRTSIHDASTRAFMSLISFEHGGKEYDDKYPEGIPTSVQVTSGGKTYDSGFIMFPAGHARYQGKPEDIDAILAHKFTTLGLLALADPATAITSLNNLANKTEKEMQHIYEFDIQYQLGPNKVDKGKRGTKRSREEPVPASELEY